MSESDDSLLRSLRNRLLLLGVPDRVLFRSRCTPTGCLEFMGSTNGGYGVFGIGSRADGTRATVRLHRFVWELENGRIPPGLLICHKCDNRKCFNPDHLFVGSYRDNTADMISKGRRPTVFVQGTANPRARLSELQVREIRQKLRSGSSAYVLAVEYGVARRTITSIQSGQNWGWLDD